MAEQSYFEKIISILVDTADSLIENPEVNAVKLRKCPDEIDMILTTAPMDDKKKHFLLLSFYLNAFIEYLWPNIFGESTYISDIEDDEIRLILKQIGMNLKRLSKSLVPVEIQTCYDCYLSLYNQYDEFVNKLNEKLKMERLK